MIEFIFNLLVLAAGIALGWYLRGGQVKARRDFLDDLILEVEYEQAADERRDPS
jgi:hypothetical protein